jgi:hypothetical protein
LSGTPWAKDTIDSDLYKRFVGLSKYGVEAYLCEITYKRQQIDMSKTRKDSISEVRAVGRGHGCRTSGQGLRLSEGGVIAVAVMRRFVRVAVVVVNAC